MSRYVTRIIFIALQNIISLLVYIIKYVFITKKIIVSPIYNTNSFYIVLYSESSSIAKLSTLVVLYNYAIIPTSGPAF